MQLNSVSIRCFGARPCRGATRRGLSLFALGAVLACGDLDPGKESDEIREEICEIPEDGDVPDYLERVGCRDDFDALASEPLDTSIPGARSVKVVLDRFDSDALYFQNSQRYRIHYEFAREHLSGRGHPLVPLLTEFNQTEYYSPDRRFLLGAVTYYEGPDVWALEIAPYDKASAELIELLYDTVERAAYFGPALVFHPTSQNIETEAEKLSANVPVASTNDLFDKIDYQPLNLGTAIGRLRFVQAENLSTEYVDFRDIVVLDHVPNDISVVSGLITEEFQTPLSHVNVLSQNRGTPNMGLRGATRHEDLRALEDSWVRLHVGAFEWSVEEVSQEEADAFWEEHKPAAIGVPRIDASIAGLHDIETLVVEGELGLRDAIKAAIPAFGGKASHYSVLAQTEGVPSPKAFAIPVHYYVEFMQQNGFDAQVEELLADTEFQGDASVRDERLAELRSAMLEAPVDEEFQTLLQDKLEAEFPDIPMRFRSSTNAEDLDGFTGAGLYTSKTGQPDDWDDVLAALREVWSSVWFFRAFEERTYRSIDHQAVGMAILVHHSFPEEEANGVALTANPFDPSGLEPGFYVNVQVDEVSVVQPPPGITTDQFVYHFSNPGQPIVYLSHSNLVAEGETVLTPQQVFDLGTALDALHQRFSAAYGPASGNNGWYAMDIEFKFDGPHGETPELAVKQARPHPGRGQE